jgi:hypothetical protein
MMNAASSLSSSPNRGVATHPRRWRTFLGEADESTGRFFI